MKQRSRLAISYLWLLTTALLVPSDAALSECVALDEGFSQFHCYTSPHKIACEDTDHRCAEWGKRGECTSNPQYMLNYCQKSCEACISGHAGTTQRVRENHPVDKVVKTMEDTRLHLKEQSAMKAKILRTCTNNNELCADWAAHGECDKNPKFMHATCAPACKVCR